MFNRAVLYAQSRSLSWAAPKIAGILVLQGTCLDKRERRIRKGSFGLFRFRRRTQALCGTMESADSGIVCTKQGAALTFSPSDSMPAVIKAEGCAIFAGTLHFGKSGTAEIKLDTLDAFIEDSSQATGLYKNDGYEAQTSPTYLRPKSAKATSSNSSSRASAAAK